MISIFLAPSCKPHRSSQPALDPPSILTATAVTTTEIDLAWSPVPPDASAVEIERSVDGGVTFVLIATLPASQTTYSDTGLTPSTRYGYRVRFVRGGDVGAYSAVVFATTITVSSVSTTGGPTTALMGHSAIYDPVGNRMIVFGGLTSSGATDELWTLSLSTSPWSWSQIPKVGLWPTPRTAHSAIFDTLYSRMIIFGGYDGTPGNELDELWILDLDPTSLTYMTWILVSTTGGNAPVARQGHSAIYDFGNQRMVIFGGADIAVAYSDVWCLNLPAPPSTSNPSTWTDISPSVAGPAPRSDLVAVYDPTGPQVILFGGQDTLAPAGPFNDVWALSLGGTPAWSQISAAGGPTARFGASAILNGAKMLVFGGYAGAANNELWQLNLGATPTWDPVTLGLSPPGARLGHTAVYTAGASTMILFAGGTAPATPFYFDVWQFGL